MSTQILVIEDDYEDVEIVEAYLAQEQQYSIQLEHCSTLKGGLERLQQRQSVDLILLDLGLIDAQGFESFQRVHRACPKIPVIVMSGNTDETVALQAMKAGAQDYLVKGQFDSNLLVRTIRYAIERQKQHLELEYKTRDLIRLSEQLKHANRKLSKLAATDGLTRIDNRRRFDESFLNEWKRLLREGGPLSVIMADVDYFKAYNDTYGHPAGDRCLQRIAQAIATVAKRPADIVARYGGEEFVIALPNTDQAGAIWVAEAIRSEIQQLNIAHSTSSVSDQITLSMGLSTQIPNPEMVPSQLLEAADRALYDAKGQGRDRICAHQSDCSVHTQRSRQRLQWVSRLRQALEQDTFQLYAQPIQALQPLRLNQRLEILLRLCDQPGTIYAPGIFFPVAEQYDFLGRIDTWVIEHLFAYVSQHQNAHFPLNHQFYINLSNTTCKNEQFVNFVEERLRTYHLSGEQFCFEISEKMVLTQVHAVSELTRSLQSLNCQVALDDFGGGTTSFLHLKKIPVNYVKIDGLFVRDIDTDRVSYAIVEAIHRVAKLMNLETIAEFVESQGVLETLCEMGVDYAQGHFFDYAKPLPQVCAALQVQQSVHKTCSYDWDEEARTVTGEISNFR